MRLWLSWVINTCLWLDRYEKSCVMNGLDKRLLGLVGCDQCDSSICSLYKNLSSPLS